MKILYVHETDVIISGIVNALHALQVDYEEYPRLLSVSFPDEREVEEIYGYVVEHGITHILAINLAGSLALAAERAGIKFLSVIWDAPYYSVFSEYGRMPHCYFAVFDKLDAQRYRERKVPHVLYQPLAADAVAIREWEREFGGGDIRQYENDICFVGSLYEGNFYDEFCRDMPQPLQDYFTGVFENAAFRWDGVNRINGTVSGELLDGIRRVTPGFELINFFEISDQKYFENYYLTRKVANIERICVLNLLAEKHQVTLYTGGNIAEQVLEGVKIMPWVSAGYDAYCVFKSSKINLNISLKGIEAGTPLRVMDIMGAGGFVMTNYCPETAELFEEDQEIVMFRTPEELLEKVDYYLVHSQKREQIARAGHEKVMRCYTFERKIRQMLDWAEEETAP